nr:hypothetical protein [Tanacetum cinerariifolium]
MNYYLYFDTPTVNRTQFALRGKDPVTSHINTIMDYSFYWFISVYDAYQYTGDKAQVQQLYPRMQSLMQYVLGRRNPDGLLEGQAGDWVFIDWADRLSKKGEVSFEQILFCRSLESMALCANLVGDTAGAATYQKLAADPYVLKEMKSYWGGMLDLGATSFWEEYDPAKKGAEHYSMYGRPFGKSLCHAWGA